VKGAETYPEGNVVPMGGAPVAGSFGSTWNGVLFLTDRPGGEGFGVLAG
jgi:hypothetical protein